MPLPRNFNRKTTEVPCDSLIEAKDENITKLKALIILSPWLGSAIAGRICRQIMHEAKALQPAS